MNPTIAAGLSRLAVALLIGLLVGIDRERAETRKHHQLFAGVRTFPMIAMAGCVPMLLVPSAGPLLLLGSLVAVAAVIVVAYLRGSAHGDIGATTEIAAIATFLLGALAGAGELVIAAAAGVAMSVLLVAKIHLEQFTRALTEQEIAAVLELAVISVIVLPLLPSTGYGPWLVLNPREIWWVVVLVAGLSFVGFVAARVMGPGRGLALAGAIGGLVSSTAVTMAMAERSKHDETTARQSAGAAVLASVIMCGRIAVLAAAINVGILPRLVPVVVAMAVVGGVFAVATLRASKTEQAQPAAAAHLENPFNLKAALTFAVIYAVVLVAVRAAQEYAGGSGIYAAAGVSALADVDAATIAVTRLGPSAGSWASPAAAVALAAVANTLVKLGIAAIMGAGAFRRIVAAALGAMAAAGAAAGTVVYFTV